DHRLLDSTQWNKAVSVFPHQPARVARETVQVESAPAGRSQAAETASACPPCAAQCVQERRPMRGGLQWFLLLMILSLNVRCNGIMIGNNVIVTLHSVQCHAWRKKRTSNVLLDSGSRRARPE